LPAAPTLYLPGQAARLLSGHTRTLARWRARRGRGRPRGASGRDWALQPWL